MKINKILIYIPVTVLCSFCSANMALTADISLRLVHETPLSLDIEVTISGYSLQESACLGYQKIAIQGCGINTQEGAPGVVLRGQLIELPEGSDVAVSYESVEKITLRNILLAPAPGAIMGKDETGAKMLKEKYRIDEAVYATDALYPGKLAVIDFTGYLRDKYVAHITCYPVQYNPVTKTVELYKKIKIHLQFTSSISDENKISVTRYLHAPLTAKTASAAYSTIYKQSLLNYKAGQISTASSSAMTKQASTFNAAALDTENSPFSLRMTIRKEGIYKVTYEELNGLGIDMTSVSNENIKITTAGKEIPTYRSGTGSFRPGDCVLFYGVPFKSLYTKDNVYWLYQGSGSGKKMDSRSAAPVNSYQIQQTFENSYHGEEDKKYWESVPNGAGADHWFWESLQPVSETKSASAQFTTRLENISTSSGNFSMKINLRGETTLAHHTRVYVNNNEVADITWQGQVEYTYTIPDIAPTVFNNGKNDDIIRFEEILDQGAPVDRIYINWFDIVYADTFTAESDILEFTGKSSGGASFEINNFTNNLISIFDVTDSLAVSVVMNAQITQSGNKYTVSFSDLVSGTKKYYAAAASSFRTPDKMVVDESSSLQSPRTDIDYIIITHDLFAGAIQELADYREAKGLRVEIVKIQDIYDEFSYGNKDANAIKSFLTYAFNNWNSADHPTYVLLVGDASIDYRDDTGNFAKGNVDFIPTNLTQTFTLGDTPTDNWFACVQGSDLYPDMLIGRLCVKTVEDVTSIVNKIKTYEEGSAGTWNKKVILASDNDTAFVSVSDELAKLLPANYSAEKIYLENYTDVNKATSDLIDKMNAGCLITNYTGHGSVDNWAGEFLFHTTDDKDQIPRNDVDLLNNGDKLTFVMTLNCLNGFFPNYLDKYSLAEELVRAENKGAVACLAPTGLGFTSQHESLATNMFNNLFVKGENIAGRLVTQSKINAYDETKAADIIETFVLFGDPATELKTTAVSSAIKLLNPGDAALLQRYGSFTFNWDDTKNSDKYKLEFSADPSFPDNSIMRAPLLMQQFINQQEYTPKFIIRLFLNIMSLRNDTLYWRVVSYDEGNKIMDYSPYRSFTIRK